MDSDNFKLDKAAEDLYKMLGNTDLPSTVNSADQLEDVPKDNILDEAAENLYQMLGGIELRSNSASSGLLEALLEEEITILRYKVLVVDFLHLLALFVSDEPGKIKAPQGSGRIDALMNLYIELANVPLQDKTMIVRFRGRTGTLKGQALEELDYLIVFGQIAFDIDLTIDLGAAIQNQTMI